MIETFNIDNMSYVSDRKFDLIYCDMIYENENCQWLFHFWKMLKNNGIFIVQTDYHTNWLIRWYFEANIELQNEAIFVNHIVWKNEWGNHPKNKFHQCYDDVIIYSKGEDWKFDSSKIQVPKATAKTKLNPSGREAKTATAWIDDICLTTTAKERVKKEDGHLIRWQKPLKLYDRIIAPFVSLGDSVLDPFMGSGSLGLWCRKNNLDYAGIEADKGVYDLALNNIYS